MLVFTALIAYGATLFSGFLSYFTGVAVFPSLIETGVPLEEVSESQGILPYFSVGIPPLMNVMTALVLAFTLGLGLAHLKSEVLKNAARDFQEIVIRMISAVILPLLPIYIFGIFLNMTHSGQVFGILMVFIKIIGVIFLLHIFLLVFQYSIAALFVRKNPLKLLGRMMPAYFTALGTQSSAATIPVTLEQSRKNGVSADIAGFVIPLCATIHLSGSTLKIVACALALMIMQGMPHDFPLFAGFIFMLGITMVAAPGVPVPPCFSVLAAACTGTIVTKSANVRQPAMHFIHVFFFMYVASLKFDDLTITQEFVRQMKKQCHFFDIIKEML